MLKDIKKDVLTPKDVQSVLGVGASTVYAMLHKNELKHRKVGKKYLIPRSAIIEFLDVTNQLKKR